jgi:hypothetical protein
VDDLKTALGPLLDEAPEPPPLADIAERARHHRRRRRGLLAVVVGILGLTVVAGAAGISSSRDTSLVAGPGPDTGDSQASSPEDEPDPAPGVDDEPATTSSTQAPPSTTNVSDTTVEDETTSTTASTTTSAPPPPQTTVIEDTQQGTTTGTVQYGGEWHPCTTTCQKAPDGRYLWASVTGTTATVRFRGSQITLYGVKEPWSRVATVSIDGGPTVDVDYYATPASPEAVVVYRSPTLADTTHTLVLTVTARRNPASTGGDAVTFDRAVVTGTP